MRVLSVTSWGLATNLMCAISSAHWWLMMYLLWSITTNSLVFGGTLSSNGHYIMFRAIDSATAERVNISSLYVLWVQIQINKWKSEYLQRHAILFEIPNNYLINEYIFPLGGSWVWLWNMKYRHRVETVIWIKDNELMNLKWFIFYGKVYTGFLTFCWSWLASAG